MPQVSQALIGAPQLQAGNRQVDGPSRSLHRWWEMQRFTEKVTEWTVQEGPTHFFMALLEKN